MPGGIDTADRDDAKETRNLAKLLLAVAFVGGLVVFSVFIMVQGGKTEGAAPNGTAARPSVPAPDGQGTETLAAPSTGVRWEAYQGIAIPYSPQHGPRTVDGYGPATGFEHSPTGALLAATHLGVRVSLAPDETWREVADVQVVPGDGRDAWISARSTISITPGLPADARLTQFVGFRLLNYTPSDATFELVTRAHDGILQVGQATVSWRQGDWQLVLEPDGRTVSEAHPVSDLSGYTQWGGVG